MELRTFATVLATRQGGIYLKPGKSYRKILTRDQVIKAFGDVPEYTVRYGLLISVTPLTNGRFEVVVRREKG